MTTAQHRSFVGAALFALLYVLMQLLMIPGMQLLVVSRSNPHLDELLLASVVGRLLAVVAATAFLLALWDRRPLTSVGLSLDSGWATEFAVGSVLGLAMMAVLAAVLVTAGQARIATDPAFSPLHWAYLGAILFLGAAAEELLFRGYGFQRVLDAVGPAGSIALLSLLFGWVHRGNPNAGPLGLANAVLVGILLALFYLRTRRLWLLIGLHWAWNFSQVSLGFPVSGIKIDQMPLAAVPLGPPGISGGAYGPEASWLCTVVVAAGFAGLLWRPKPAVARGSEEGYAP